MRGMKLVLGGLLLAGACYGLWRLTAPAPSEEERIRAAFAAAATAAEERRPAGVVELLSAGFRGQRGLDREQARGIVTLEVLRAGWVSVTIAGAEVQVDGERARANVDAVLSRAPAGTGLARLVPSEASAHRFSCDLRLEDGEWRVVSAEWRPIELADALQGPPAPEPLDAPAEAP
ncbi:MAG: hypothetical protein QM767_11795 [Anaeromyxobacter sp.]